MTDARKNISGPSPSKLSGGADWRVAVICLALAAITFAVFGQTTGFEFVNFDDDLYVYENATVAGGLSLAGFRWVFTHMDCSLYHPLTMLSLMADHQLHGLHAGDYHLTNVLLHTASAVLLFLVLRQMTGALWCSAFVAAVFAVHPLRVESVAWVSERKDVLGTFFFMLTLGAYVHYVRNPASLARYLMVGAVFVLALLSKPTVVTLPFLLLLLDYWPLNRFKQEGPVRQSECCGIPRRLILEKIPLLVLAVAACAMTVLAAKKGIVAPGQISLFSRLSNAAISYSEYLYQMVWPARLVVLYPYRGNTPPWNLALAAALLAGLSAIAVWQRRKRPWLLVGWFWYLGMLVPMVGILRVGAFAHADRYTYLPQIGIYMAVTWLVAGWRINRTVVGWLMTGVIAALMVCAWKQTAYWKDSESLWNHTLACTTGNCVAQLNLGNAVLPKGRVDEAIVHYQKALQTNPDFAEAHYNLGVALGQKGKADEAIAQFQKALQIDPDYAAAHVNFGNALLQQGRVDEAIAHYQKALQIKADFAEAHFNLGRALFQSARVDEAIAHYEKALQFNPSLADARYNLGAALLKKGRVDEATGLYENMLEINPNDATAHCSLAAALEQKGRVDEAITHLQKALQINPACTNAHRDLGNAYMQKGNATDAIAQFQQALQIQPNEPSTQNNLAWLLATSAEASLRNGEKGVQLARQANELTRGADPSILDTLAAALAEAGRFPEAVDAAQRALHLAGAQSNTTLVTELQSELKLYQAGRPFHSPAPAH